MDAKNEGYLFARKFDIDYDKKIIFKIYDNVKE